MRAPLKPETEHLISEYTERSKEILKDNLVGVYLHGSAVMGCFNPEKSDIDLIIVVDQPLSDAVKKAYMDMVVKYSALGPAKGIEMSIVLKKVCKPFIYPTPFELHFSEGHLAWYKEDPEGYIRKMQGTDKDLAAHFTVIRSRGQCLYGKPVGEVFGAVPERDYMDSLWYDVSDAERDIADHPMYMILNLSRVLAFARERAVLSKREGGEWGLRNLPEEYKPLIRCALREYASGEDIRYDIETAKRYASHMLKQIGKAWEAKPECLQEEKQ